MRDSFGDKLFYSINYIILAFAGIICLLPLLHILSVSFSSSQAVMSGQVGLWPVEFSLDTYVIMLKGSRVIGAFKNSTIITVIGVILCMIFTIMAAYPLSRKFFYARRFFTLAIVFTMLFGGGMIPTYLVIKSLGLINHYGALWFPGLIGVSNMLVLRTFFSNISEELEDAARIDGCEELRLLLQITLPLSTAVIATLSLFYAVGHWNAFMSLLIYLNDTEKYNLTVLVQQMISSANFLRDQTNMQIEDTSSIIPQTMRSAGIIVMILPMLLVYPFLQKYFVKGIMLGSIKG